MERVREVPIPGPVPRYVIPGWDERYGVYAGITGREEPAGESAPSGDFDLGLWGTGSVRVAMERWNAFRTAEPGFASVRLAHQCHGIRVLVHENASPGWEIVDAADGHVTGQRGVLLVVTVADCIPVYLHDPVGGVIGLLHSGWRGTAGDILAAGIAAMIGRLGCVVENIVMHCGVGICGACYEVGSEVMDGCGKLREGAGPWRLDLREALADRGRELGVREVSTSHFCSKDDSAHFFSHRGSGGADGRMVAFIGMRPSAEGTG